MAFVLGAVLAPTDATAVSAVAALLPPPGPDRAPGGEPDQRRDRSGHLRTRAPESTFTGDVQIGGYFQRPAPSRLAGASASFTPGSRTPWKVNPVSQTLVVTSGVGWAQIEGEPVVEIRAGDFVWCPPGQRHWEGATSDQAMSYVAIQEEGDAGRVQFLNRVTDEQYQAGPPPA